MPMIRSEDGEMENIQEKHKESISNKLHDRQYPVDLDIWNMH